ncbi:CatB-related O-acetyltransferase [Pseudoprimorskyibacter insulae]|uniref:Streptogramin A acetyltransferase n=1 Tax=Pseudoprimorskyibacter insulae TaxID=1695997 RepID=A0A2R8AYA6_9RHOB|nr:CatB-related O-acetyltransferase [Pseudoprimorskyibacter insulae]SPF80988.1 Streptogramin A acetyltransferase [Pseudoprimorskyibacter insulae]
MPYPLPDAAGLHPITLPDGSTHLGTVHLNRAIQHPRLSIGDYTYASDFDPPQDWAARLFPYLFPFSQEQVTIGRFCQIAHGVRVLTSSANHQADGISTYPFAVMSPGTMPGYQPDTRDTVIGNDVWLGYGAIIAPGACIGNGVIVGAGAVVRGHIPDYAIITGNPAQIHKMRFDNPTIARLNALAWWDWPPEWIAEAAPHLETADLKKLEALAP